MFRLNRSVSRPLCSLFRLAGDLTLDGVRFLGAILRARTAMSAEILFLRKRLAFYQEHQVRPRRLTDSARFSLVFWSRLFDWKEALVIVKPETLIGWHRQGFKVFWKWKCRVGRPRLPGDIRQLSQILFNQLFRFVQPFDLSDHQLLISFVVNSVALLLWLMW